jgi:hypothetical protein
MYRIVREENKLTGRVRYIIEQKKGWFRKSWTRELGILGIQGAIGGATLNGAKIKLEIIKSGNHIVKDIMEVHR